MKEEYYDKLLNIKTTGDQKGFNQSLHYHRYEPTPYSALEALFNEYELKSSDRLVDFGCGKGRLNFYVNYLYNTTVVGIEMNETFFQEAVANQHSYLKKNKSRKNKIHFHRCLAEDYQINPSDNRFYFFNPFSIQVFRNIITNILLSAEKSARKIEVLLYYPSADYIYFLENHTHFELKEEVKLQKLYAHNSHERFLVYRLAY
ncbi:methyltransferase [Bacillus sp. V33-4]|uniref:methyltransferase n=1 Tax=Bacillus sp. V33-4 TaxID=2054169 RepID=UPI000C771207|nr:methyltransferase [Bacillus sp. V33-4]PLR86920.1 SAM-dependent methyltransferase [Bacillus sp. V33-4]